MFQPGINLIKAPLKVLLMKYEPERGQLWEKWNLCQSYVEHFSENSSPKVLQNRLLEYFLAWESEIVSEAIKSRSKKSEDASYRRQQRIQSLLEEALSELEKRFNESGSLSGNLRAVIKKIKKAKEINHIHELQEHMIEIGNNMLYSLELNEQSMARTMNSYRDSIESLTDELDEFKDEADRDSLTGVLKKEVLERDLHAYVQSATERSQSLGLMIFQIDECKHIDGLSQEEVHDKVLKGFAGLLRESIRETDMIYRFNSMQFAILLPRCSLTGGGMLSQKIMDFVDSHSYRFGKQSLHVQMKTVFQMIEKNETGEDFFNRTMKGLNMAKVLHLSR